MDEINLGQPIEDDPKRELTEDEKLFLAQQYDNEWVKFLKDLAENTSVKDILDYIEANKWTDRQRKTIMHYSKVVLGRGLSTTFLTSQIDYLMLKDDKALIDCDIPLSMTVYDMTPEFMILMDMVRLHFNIESRKSKGALFLKGIGKQTHRIEHEEVMKDKQGFKEKLFGGS